VSKIRKDEKMTTRRNESDKDIQAELRKGNIVQIIEDSLDY
jgi:hypothetical protein